jgi:hypothetical protein
VCDLNENQDDIQVKELLGTNILNNRCIWVTEELWDDRTRGANGRYWYHGLRMGSWDEIFIDYRYAGGRFTMLPRGVTVSYQNYLSSSETRIIANRRRWKLHLSESTWFQESLGGICFASNWIAAFL